MHHLRFGNVRADVDTLVAGEQVRAFRCWFGQGFIAASNNTLLRSQIHKMHKSGSAITFDNPQQNNIFFCAHVPVLRRLFLVNWDTSAACIHFFPIFVKIIPRIYGLICDLNFCSFVLLHYNSFLLVFRDIVFFDSSLSIVVLLSLLVFLCLGP